MPESYRDFFHFSVKILVVKHELQKNGVSEKPVPFFQKNRVRINTGKGKNQKILSHF